MLAVAIIAAFLLATVFYPALRLNRHARSLVLVLLVLPVALTPLLVPSRLAFPRLLASIFAIASIAKLYDLHVGAQRGSVPDLLSFLIFLLNHALLVLRKAQAERRPSRREDLFRFVSGSLGSIAGAAILAVTFRTDWRRLPFALEHSTKVVACFLFLIPTVTAAVAVLRYVGIPVREPMNNPFAARTPADFWKRYNRPAQQWFYEDVFRPFGGLRMPICATLLTFAVSALVHEYVFLIPVGKVQGYQTAFFLTQGCAVAATLRVRPTGWQIPACVAGTFLFNIASSVLFFASVNQVIPFYVARSA